jgi:hypothetical protein
MGPRLGANRANRANTVKLKVLTEGEDIGDYSIENSGGDTCLYGMQKTVCDVTSEFIMKFREK